MYSNKKSIRKLSMILTIVFILLIAAACKTSREPSLLPVELPSESARSGLLDGVNIWQLPDAPDGSKPDQSWLAVGSDPYGDIYISGHDHRTNSMLYRLDHSDGILRWVGDARQASKAAENWNPGETAEKFHTRPVYHDGRVYVATLDKSGMDDAFRYTRGFHWYAYDLIENDFIDLSASETNGVGAETLQIVTIQIDSSSETLYGMSIPENKVVSYDIASGITTVLGNPPAWKGYFYSNRYMWVDSRGRLYISGGTERNQWNQGEDASVFNHIWYYDKSKGFGETSFLLEGANSMEVGQWDRTHRNLYVSDDLGHIYRFTDEDSTWTYLGRPGFPEGEVGNYNNNKIWVFNLSADEEKIYLGRSDNRDTTNEIWEYDITSGTSSKLCSIDDLDSTSGRKAFITGYDSWDNNGSFYMSVFSMNDFQNVYLMGVNPVRLKVAKGLLPELVEVCALQSGNDVQITRSGAVVNPLEVLYQVHWSNSDGVVIETTFGEAVIASGESELTISSGDIPNAVSSDISSVIFSVKADGNDYIIGTDFEAPITGFSFP